jgi:membrane protein DedA with SNARE-associated domain
VGLCSGAGFLFGNIPVVKNNFEAVVLGIIAVSALPLVIEWLWSWWSRRGMSGTHTSAEGADDQSVATPPAA